MAVVLIGHGPNDVKIVSMVFETMQSGLEQVTSILGEPVKKEDSYLWNDEIDEKLNEETGVINKYTYNGKEYEEPETLACKFFTSYYDGCGGCYSLELKEIEYGKPFVPFNLD